VNHIPTRPKEQQEGESPLKWQEERRREDHRPDVKAGRSAFSSGKSPAREIKIDNEDF